MENNITFLELFISLVPILIGGIGAWLKIKTTISTLCTQIEYLQKELSEEKEGNKDNFEKLNNKMDTLFSKIGEVRELILKNRH